MKKYTHFTLLFLVFLFTLSGCSDIPAPITMPDTNKITGFTYQITSFPEQLPLTLDTNTIYKANASDSAAFVTLTGLVYDLEFDRFNKLAAEEDLSLYQADDKDSLHITIVPLFESSEDYNTNGAASSNSLSDDTESTNTTKNAIALANGFTGYTLNLDPENITGIFSCGTHFITLDGELVTDLLNSNLLPYDKTAFKAPMISLSFIEQVINYEGFVEFNEKIYLDRYHTSLQQFNLKDNLFITSSDQAIQIDFLNTPPSKLSYTIKPLSTSKGTSTVIDVVSNDLSLPLPNESGNYTMTIDMDWDESKEIGGYGKGLITFDFSIELDEVFTLNHDSYEPGDLIVVEGINMDSDNNYIIETDIYNEGLDFLSVNDKGYLFIPLMSKTTPGTYSLTIKDPDYPDKIFSHTILVSEKAFDEQYLETSSATASLRNDAAYEELYAAFDIGRSNLSEDMLWEGPFIQPVTGRVSTEYGEIRYTNGSTVSSRHGGIDFAVPQGTVILAPANGYITLARELTVTGNTVFIDHGLGILSQNYHLYDIYVNEGDYVKQGDPIGEVGSTGFSTGAHLHYAIYNNSIYINPWKFFEASPIE